MMSAELLYGIVPYHRDWAIWHTSYKIFFKHETVLKRTSSIFCHLKRLERNKFEFISSLIMSCASSTHGNRVSKTVSYNWQKLSISQNLLDAPFCSFSPMYILNASKPRHPRLWRGKSINSDIKMRIFRIGTLLALRRIVRFIWTF